MHERRCFVQFIHPGREHAPDALDSKAWNRGSHRRKFLASRGRYLADGHAKQGDIEFWGEWEPESRIITRYETRVPDGPHWLYAPHFEDHGDEVWRQNTDPFVFGDQFHYTGCKQHTRRGATQLRYLASGSVILFGSCLGRSRFVVDTVFVVDSFIDHTADDWREKTAGVSSDFRDVTLEPWYRGRFPTARSHRLYSGATQESQTAGMHSFFPCMPGDRAPHGFARPEIQLPGYVTPHLTQGNKIARDLALPAIAELWNEVVRQVEAQGLCLGTGAELPVRRSVGGSSAEDARSVGRC